MKKVFAVLFICAVISACGGSKKSGGGADSGNAADQTAKAQEPNVDTSVNKTGTTVNTGELAPGAKLMASADCNTCHKADTKVVGPALKDIAAKYPPTQANIDTLANKVIHGGSGHWGNIPMAQHPTLAVNDAKEMVKYILSLKK